MATGTIKKVVADRGFGFIVAEDEKEFFFHRSAVDATLDFDRLQGGESVEFETQPTYLAVGSSDAELTIGAGRVDLARFVQNGQIRIRAGDFDALVQGASPIPAPTVATVR